MGISNTEGGAVESLGNPRWKFPMRSKLFVPGSRPELFPKAQKSAADALSFDLEDAVVADRKAEARSEVAAFLRANSELSEKVIVVRVNGLSSLHFQPDIEAVVGAGLDIINLPKIESREDILFAVEVIRKVESASQTGAQVGILANIESPKGLRQALDIATADPRVMGLQIGFTDLSSTCGFRPHNTVALDAVRFSVRCATAEAGIATFDGAFTDVKDGEAFRREAVDARDLGFSGKSCIHPSQVPIANQVYSPTMDQIARAQALLAAAALATQRGLGAFVHEGEMVDVPVIARARSLVNLAARLGIEMQR
jgi:citrate lyase subunit beta/citryl-CoA lyase